MGQVLLVHVKYKSCQVLQINATSTLKNYLSRNTHVLGPYQVQSTIKLHYNVFTTYSLYMNALKENGFTSHDDETAKEEKESEQLHIECRKLENERQKLLEDIENLRCKKSSLTGKSNLYLLSLII